ncbi:hypothetical protein C0Q70_02190 [Pomacea canaliculata]|uniref:Uncharacterized protein n=1 Tax=Pomacea canaliculata TaxID=400727 RepID=A0A2T7Q1K6_POMCA|nr:hypothetical protein C0Q70_02190 [Pomacea canaliculata]
MFIFQTQEQGISSRCTRAKLSTSSWRCTKEESSDSAPIKFSTSKAASWSLANAANNQKQEIPWHQTLSVAISTGVFLIYFLYLREENDLDLELSRPLFERVPHLEESQLKIAIKYAQEHGKDTKELEERLVQLHEEKGTDTPNQ